MSTNKSTADDIFNVPEKPFIEQVDDALKTNELMISEIDHQEKQRCNFVISDATKDDFCTTIPYEYLYSLRQDRFRHDIKRDELADAAKLLGIRNFKKRYENYVNDIRCQFAKPVGAVTDFQDQPLELLTGKWQATESGVWCEGEYQTQEACSHPIMPVERLINVDSGMEKMRIAFRSGKHWREYIADKSTLASAQAIIALSDYGISVTSETAKNLVRYFQDIEHLNYDLIPEKRSVGRLGWISGQGFSPYVEGLIFDGDHNFRTLFESVKKHGNESDWLKLASEIRQGSLTGKIVLAASFASVLVGPCGCLPFFVHLWGAESGTGKTVALMVAASVWACPAIGQYIQTFNSTAVSKERIASLCNSLPVLIDELQLNNGGSKYKGDFNPYMLAEGVGKGRGTKTGGIERTMTWANCIITTGESPLVTVSAGSGAVNRVLDIECNEECPVVSDGHRIAETVKKNYGFAGRLFVEHLQHDGFDEAKELYHQAFNELILGDTTEKQAMAAALIIAADQLVTDWIFNDDKQITIQEIRLFMASKAEVSSMHRGYEFIKDWLAQNENKFRQDNPNDRYGEITSDTIYIIKNTFDKAVESEGFSARALLSWMNKRGLIKTNPGRMTIKRRMGDVTISCVGLKRTEEENPFNV